ncbi:MAG TPA: DUF4389 domain-containing protein [Dehalococcoidia bacterium]|nr:DUF4389 domain-containing protein [Dehalococcoidia bacterium]
MALAVPTEGSPVALPARLAPQYPLIYTLPYPARQSRWKAALRLVFALPELVALLLVYWLLYPLALADWLIIVFSGRLDRTLWGFSVAVLRWVAAVLSYVTLLRDEYPGAGRGFPIRFELAYPVRRSRVRALFRLVLILPQLYVVQILLVPLLVGAIIAWFAIVLSGQYPEGIWRLEAGLNRWILRVAAYGLLLRDDYPPFTLGLWEPATLEALGVDFEPASSARAPELNEDGVERMGRVAGIPIWPDAEDPLRARPAAAAGVLPERSGLDAPAAGTPFPEDAAFFPSPPAPAQDAAPPEPPPSTESDRR